jgi:hypothetical protein
MGWFNWFKRKPAHPDDPFNLGPVGQPRCHHYTLAHHALRQVAFGQPLAFFGALASPEAYKLLSELLASVNEHCRHEEPRPDFSVDDIGIHPLRVGGRICLVLEMPRPRAVTETHFVAAGLLKEPTEIAPSDDEHALPVRYFTLEFGLPERGEPRTVLCEWTNDGSHLNYGDGPPAELQAFVGAIEAMLEKNGASDK